MKVRCIDDLGLTKLEVGKIYEGELKFSEWWGQDRWYIKGMENLCFREHAFEIVKEDNMEKTFREVIADIKEGEVWESAQDCFQLKEISCIEGRIKFKLEGVFVEKTDNLNNVNTGEGNGQTFELQRKQYTFEEAFKAYEEGKEIESCEVLTGCYPSKYKRIANKDAQWIEESYSWDKRKYIGIPFYEVRGKWYINN